MLSDKDQIVNKGRWVSKIGDFMPNLFILACIILISIISYNLGQINSLKKTPIQLIDANIFNQTTVKPISGSVPKSATRVGESVKQVVPTPRDPRVVTSKNSDKYHYSWCASGKKIKEENKVWFENETAAQAAGYTLAGNCQ